MPWKTIAGGSETYVPKLLAPLGGRVHKGAAPLAIARREDGVTLSFQITPGTEAPAEMNFYLPQMRAVFMAENANATMHNLLPARGALATISR